MPGFLCRYFQSLFASWNASNVIAFVLLNINFLWEEGLYLIFFLYPLCMIFTTFHVSFIIHMIFKGSSVHVKQIVYYSYYKWPIKLVTSNRDIAFKTHLIYSFFFNWKVADRYFFFWFVITNICIILSRKLRWF